MPSTVLHITAQHGVAALLSPDSVHQRGVHCQQRGVDAQGDEARQVGGKLEGVPAVRCHGGRPGENGEQRGKRRC